MPPANPPRPGGIIASWSGTAYSTRQVWLISQLTSISEGLSPIRHPGTRLVGDGRPTTELEVAYSRSALPTADGTPCAIWRQHDANKTARSRTPGKKGCRATWKLDLRFPATDNGTSARLPHTPSPLQFLHKGTGGSEQQWFKPGAYACGRHTYLQNRQWHPHSSHRCSGAAGKSVTFVPRDRVRNQSKQGASPVVHPQQQRSRTSNVSSLLQWKIKERTNSLRYLGIQFDRMLTYKTQVESTKLRCRKGLSALKPMASKGIEQRHLFLLYQSVILNVIDYGRGLTTLSQSTLLKLDRVQSEALRVILGTTNDTPIEAMCYCNGPGVVQRKDRQKKEFHDQSDYR